MEREVSFSTITPSQQEPLEGSLGKLLGEGIQSWVEVGFGGRRMHKMITFRAGLGPAPDLLYMRYQPLPSLGVDTLLSEVGHAAQRRRVTCFVAI